MNKLHLVLKVIGCLVIVITVFAILNMEKIKYGPDRTERTFFVTVASIKEGSAVTTAEIQKLEKNAVVTLRGVSVHLEGIEAVKSRKGIIIYEYDVVNSDSSGYGRLGYEVELDMKKQAITSIDKKTDPRSRGEKGYTPLKELTGYLDIDETLDTLESNKTFIYPDDPIVTIHIDREKNSITVDSELGVKERFYVNNSTKQIVSPGKFFTPTPK